MLPGQQEPSWPRPVLTPLAYRCPTSTLPTRYSQALVYFLMDPFSHLIHSFYLIFSLALNKMEPILRRRTSAPQGQEPLVSTNPDWSRRCLSRNHVPSNRTQPCSAEKSLYSALSCCRISPLSIVSLLMQYGDFVNLDTALSYLNAKDFVTA